MTAKLLNSSGSGVVGNPGAISKRLTGPLRSSSRIQAKLRTSTLIQSGISTADSSSARHPAVSRVSARAST